MEAAKRRRGICSRVRRSNKRKRKPSIVSGKASTVLAPIQTEVLHSHDFYQTPSQVIASLFLKKIDKARAIVDFNSQSTVSLDLHTSNNTRYEAEIPLFGQILPAESTYKIMGTKLELTLAKANGVSWATLRSDEQRPNEILQVGQAARA